MEGLEVVVGNKNNEGRLLLLIGVGDLNNLADGEPLELIVSALKFGEVLRN